MNLRYTLIAGLLAALNLTSCTTVDYDSQVSPARPYVPRVTMPVDLNNHEQNLVGDVEHSLEQNGLRPTDRAGAEYQLAFSVEDGPVNADVTLDLFQGRTRIAHAYARVGGPRIVFQRQRVIREAFDKALQQFEMQLPRTGGSRDGSGRYGNDSGRYGNDSGRYGNDYENGQRQPDPYGTSNPYQQGNYGQSGYQ